MASNTKQGNETTSINAEGIKEVKVDTVDYRSTPGHPEQGTTKENIQVIHQTDPAADATSTGVVAGATEAVANAVRSAKDAIASNTPK